MSDIVYTPAWMDVLNEREKQRRMWPTEHDDQHEPGALSALAAYVAHPAAERVDVDAWLEVERAGNSLRSRHDPRERLVIAAALCIAEIERLDRMEAPRG